MANSEHYKVGIIGSGRMGSDIFYYLSDFYFNLTLICLNEREREKMNGAYLAKLDRRRRNSLVDDALFSFRKSNTNITCSLHDVSECDIVIEAIPEDAGEKNRLFLELDPLVGNDTVVVSNSSSIKPSLLIRGVRRTGCYAGLHFFFPVKYRNIVEVITTSCTSESSLKLITSFLSAIKKFYLVMHERDGFMLNRMFLNLQAQAYRYFDEGALGVREIDAIIKQDMFPIGVFEFFDSVGIDVLCQSVLNYTENATDREFYRPLLSGMKKMVCENRLGKKTGIGFYDYRVKDLGESGHCRDDLRKGVSSCLVSLYINSAFKALEKNACTADCLEYAVKEYMGVEKGPFALAEEIGHVKIRETLLRHFKKTGFEAFSPSSLIKPAQADPASG
jgi:3-hydroxybutyryl-CoA dehydrogenase